MMKIIRIRIMNNNNMTVMVVYTYDSIENNE